jgi:hypothetical protein
MKLKLVLGPVQLVFYSVGIIIGAGVYSVIGAAAGSAQRSLWASFIVAAVVTLLTGLPASTVVGIPRGDPCEDRTAAACAAESGAADRRTLDAILEGRSQ